jgi:hypothetical protein
VSQSVASVAVVQTSPNKEKWKKELEDLKKDMDNQILSLKKSIIQNMKATENISTTVKNLKEDIDEKTIR